MRSKRPFELANLVLLDIIAQKAPTSISGGGSSRHRYCQGYNNKIFLNNNIL